MVHGLACYTKSVIGGLFIKSQLFKFLYAIQLAKSCHKPELLIIIDLHFPINVNNINSNIHTI